MDVLFRGRKAENGKLTVSAGFYLLMMDVIKKSADTQTNFFLLESR